jgi:glyoxylase-like metal-dependent hydrolase (beta-lactamase superfamily II)
MTPQDVAASPLTPARWAIGNIKVFRIDEILLPPATGRWLLPEATPDLVAQAPWLMPDFATPEGLHLAVHSFGIVIDGMHILVDTGIGNGKTRANPAWNNLNTPYLDRLAAAGFSPENVDLVILTHLHTDHVGWNTQLNSDGLWEPTFPNARYLVAQAEDAYWSGVEMDESRRQMFTDSVDPIRAAGLLDTIALPEEGIEILNGLRLVPRPGHTPGQLSVHLSSGTHSAVISGDALHHPVQLHDHHLCSSVDIDPKKAVETRRALLMEIAGTETILLGSHFPSPTAGTVVTDGHGFRLMPSTGQG